MAFKSFKIGLPAALLTITPTVVAILSNIKYEEFEPVSKVDVIDSPKRIEIPIRKPTLPSWSSKPIVVTSTKTVKIKDWKGKKKGSGLVKLIRVKRPKGARKLAQAKKSNLKINQTAQN